MCNNYLFFMAIVHSSLAACCGHHGAGTTPSCSGCADPIRRISHRLVVASSGIGCTVSTNTSLAAGASSSSSSSKYRWVMAVTLSSHLVLSSAPCMFSQFSETKM